MSKLNSKVDGEEIVRTETKQYKQKQLKGFFLMPESTRTLLLNGGKMEDAKEITYDKIKKYIEKHRRDLFKGGVKYKINLLTVVGWRGGKFFGKDDEISWFNPGVDYGDGIDIDQIYAVQIIVL